MRVKEVYRVILHDSLCSPVYNDGGGLEIFLFNLSIAYGAFESVG